MVNMAHGSVEMAPLDMFAPRKICGGSHTEGETLETTKSHCQQRPGIYQVSSTHCLQPSATLSTELAATDLSTRFCVNLHTRG